MDRQQNPTPDLSPAAHPSPSAAPTVAVGVSGDERVFATQDAQAEAARSLPLAAEPSREDLAPFTPEGRGRMDRFDEIDERYVREAMALRDQQEGARIGDFVRFPDGALHRLARSVGDDRFQTMEPGRGAFFLWRDGDLTFSCGILSLDPFVEKRNLTLMDEARGGEVWLFHHQDVVPGGRVDATPLFRVYAYTQSNPDSTQ